MSSSVNLIGVSRQLSQRRIGRCWPSRLLIVQTILVTLLFTAIIALAAPPELLTAPVPASTTSSPPTQATTTSANASIPATVPTTSNALGDGFHEITVVNVNYSRDEKDILAAKQAIKQHIAKGPNESRIILKRPTLPPQMIDYAPDSAEAKVADSASQFGLAFIRNLQADIKENLVISPLSLQNLLNMVLLGTGDSSSAQSELSKTLGYETNKLLLDPKTDRLKAHEAMHNLLDNIMAATHLTVTQPELLNTNTAALSTEAPAESGKVDALLQTSTRQDGLPLTGQINFTLANLVLTNKDAIQLKPDYEKDLKSYYNVNVERFSRKRADNKTTGGEKSPPLHEQVNNWVRNMTQNQIEKLAEASDLNGDDLIMVLLNAAHFKGRWLHTFNVKATSEKNFHNYGSLNDVSKVKFMRQKGVFQYADFGTAALQAAMRAEASESKTTEDDETLLTEDIGGKPTVNQTSTSEAPVMNESAKMGAKRSELTSKLNCSALLLPFSLNDGQELSMLLLLPTKREGIDELIGALSGPALNEIYRSLYEQQVQVELPKFSFEGNHDAKSALLRMGLKSIFLESADLSRMYELKSGSKQPAKVDKIIHKAKISVDESGAEAAAASMASIVSRTFVIMPTSTFVADHPFLFIIRHNRSNMPMFMGRVSSL